MWISPKYILSTLLIIVHLWLITCIYRYGGRFIDNLYGTGSGRLWLDDVQCSGTETDIDHCEHSDWGMNNCARDEDVSIECGEGRL